MSHPRGDATTGEAHRGRATAGGLVDRSAALVLPANAVPVFAH